MTDIPSSPAKTLLSARGFELLGPNPDNRKETLWLRQTTVRHIMLSLPPDASQDDVIDAVFDAGRESTRAHIYQKYNDFLLSLRVLNDMPALLPKSKPVEPSKL